MPPKTTIRLGKRSSTSDHDHNQTKRLKLTASAPQESPREITTPDARPKRHASKPKRYSDPSQPASVEKSLTTPRGDSPKITIKAKAKPAPAHVSDDDEEAPASYTQDFLMNYIDDAPPTAAPPKQKVGESAPRRVSAPIPDNPYKVRADTGRRESAPMPLAKPTKSAPSQQHIRECRDDPTGRSYYANVIDRPPMQDDEETMLKKLDAAILSLARLSIPTPRNPVFNANVIERQADSLVKIVTGCSSPVRETLPASRTGTPDTELRILIQNAISMLSTSMVDKSLRLAEQALNAGKSHVDPKLQPAIDADKFAMAALETVTYSSALNINCVVSRERTSMLWTLYMALLYLIAPPPVPPHQPMPPPRRPAGAVSQDTSPSNTVKLPSVSNTAYTVGTIEGAVDNFKAYEERGARGTPPPHHFLLREHQTAKSLSDNSRNYDIMPPPPIPTRRQPQVNTPPHQTVTAR
ncbi:hypothetical protein CAC42_6717 [Sphaceloma murrayae]|uniref:Uncharacterized protein n=1 Tax=Sphaceloma murrayae TaxID=2082308 RepID=A0A2K1QGA0_9PEZI|nr:hypothetical protein CAC42_6717 [Sphaceloma murrayae]